MKQVTIPPFSITTTKIGFGCSSLVGVLSPRQGEALVSAAYDTGIRHFDVARSYGRGMAEFVLGRALGSRRLNVTITSKFGIPVAQDGLLNTARAALRPVARRFSGLRSPAMSLSSVPVRNTDFSRSNAEFSLETTLKQLGTDYLDILLLHEATAENIKESNLLEFLERARESGKIRGYGIGTQTGNIPLLIAECPMFCSIVQHEWSPLIGEVEIPAVSARITHGSLARSFQLLRERFRENKALAGSASEATGLNITAQQNLSALLLRGAALKYPDSIILFSSRTLERVRENVERIGDESLNRQSAALTAFLAANRDQLLGK